MEKIKDQLKRIAELDNGKPRKNIVIIGSGMAGLSAAYELLKLGHGVSIIEATNRVGGRVRTHTFKPSNEYHELGAMRIPASHDYTRHYITITGLDPALRPFVTGHDNLNCFYYLRGKVSRIRDVGKSLLNDYRLSAHERLLATKHVPPAILGNHFGNTLKSLSETDRVSMFGERFLTDRAAELEQQSLGEYFERRLGSDDARELIGATTGLEVWWEKAVSQFLRDEIVDTATGLDEIEGGLDRLPNELADILGRHHIRFNTAVVSFELREDGVLLCTQPTDSTRWDSPPLADAPVTQEKADFVICTIPFGVLRRMDVKGLSALKMRAIRNLSYASSTKVLLHCSTRFWELGTPDEQIVGGASFTDEITRSTYYPSDHARAKPVSFANQTGREGFRSIVSNFTTRAERVDKVATPGGPGPGVLVGSYNWGSDARRLGAVPVKERGDVVMDVIKNFHPEIRRYVDQDAASMYWDDFRWSAGAFCFMQPGDFKDYYYDAIRAEGRVHFAGEHCSLDQGWQQGAIISGIRAVEELVQL